MDRVSFLIAIFGILLHCAAAQNVYTVGDGVGWTVPQNASVYANWASGKTFMVGDVLVFNFVTNQHDVLRVPEASYQACTQDNAIGSIITTGPANITLDSAGDHHFICTVGRHCQFGQKLAVTVGSSTPGGGNPPATAPPTTPTTPSPASPQPDDCAPTPSSTPNAGGPAASPPTTPTTPSPASSQPDACAPTPSSTPNAGGPAELRTTQSSPPDSASTSLAGGFLLILLSAGIALIF